MRALIWGAVLSFLSLACQNYSFEELPSSVIQEKVDTKIINVASEIDILFVIDNSGSMVGEQRALARSFSAFVEVLDKSFGRDKYHIAITTTGIQSVRCPACADISGPIASSCMNETGESGVFQNRIGHIIGPNPTYDTWDFEFTESEACRIIDSSDEKTCFYDPATESGTVLVGVNGCGYERGLAAMRRALSPPLIDEPDGPNRGFLRDNATLAVILVSDEEDCCEVGDVCEETGAGGKICYYAAKEVGPGGTFSHPDDPLSTPYHLTREDEYYKFLMDLKGNRPGMVKFVAIVGVRDVDDLNSTTIEYIDESNVNSDYEAACTTTPCDSYCEAWPGTRYIRLAQKFGIGDNGLVDTLCQEDFSDAMTRIGEFVSCPREFLLTESSLDSGLANILINGEPVPRYSCSAEEVTPDIQECTGPEDASCPAGSSCVETWSH